jgi:hypothetical protein
MFVDAACFELHIMAGRSDCSAGAGAHGKMLGSRGVRTEEERWEDDHMSEGILRSTKGPIAVEWVGVEEDDGQRRTTQQEVRQPAL